MLLGAILKSIRRDKEYTLGDVARRLDISTSLLSQIENDRVQPSLHTLSTLLALYETPLSDFFRQAEHKRYQFISRLDSERLTYHGEGFSLTLLASKLQNNSLESFIVELRPGGAIDIAELSREYRGERMIYVIAGAPSVTIDNEGPFALEGGDSINFKCHTPCAIANPSGSDARFVITGIPPIFL